MKIGLDFDGVITNFPKFKKGIIKEIHGIDIDDDNFSKEKIIANKILTLEEYSKYFNAYADYEMSIKHLEFPQDAKKYITKLSKNNQLKIVTARDKIQSEIAKKWLSTNGINLEIVYTSEGSKAPHLTGFDVYIDDDINHLLKVFSVVKNIYLYDWPHNKSVDTKGIATKVKSWKEFYKKIQSIK